MPNGVHEIKPEESRRMQLILQLYKRGELSPEKVRDLQELQKRGVLTLPMTRKEELQTKWTQTRKEVFDEMASEIGPIRAYLIGTGKGLSTVGRGFMGLMESASGLPLRKATGLGRELTEEEIEAERALKGVHPYAYGAGEITGEAAPFVPLAVGTGGSGLGLRAAVTGGAGALEGGIISRGHGQSAAPGAVAGGVFGVGAEILLPVVGRAANKVFNKVMGRAPRGALLDAIGQPTGELLDALDTAGMTFDDLVGDSQKIVAEAMPGARSEQVVRQALAAGEEIPLTRGELTRGFAQQFREQRLLESAYSDAAEPFRQFKLRQSEAIKSRLTDLLQGSPNAEETGELIKDALIGRRKLLRTEKNALYKQVAEQTKDMGGIPIFTDDIANALPDQRTLKRLDRISKGAVNDGLETLEEYGIISTGREGIDIDPLSVENFEEVRQALNMIIDGDTSKAAGVAFRPVIKALDNELDEMTDMMSLGLGERAMPEGVLNTLKEARKRVRIEKTEFSPQAFVGKLVDVKKDGVTDIIEASKVYDKLSARSMPVENVRKLVTSLGKSGDQGQQAIRSLQTSTILDLISAGFGTESRKISGVKVFNPIAFKKRMKTLGEDKLKAIFKGNPEALKRLNNIEKIAKDLIPENIAVPKGSSSSLLDLASRLLATKIPGGNLALSVLKNSVEPITTATGTRRAIKNVTPEVLKMRGLLEQQFPGIASALGIATILGEENEKTYNIRDIDFTQPSL